MGLMAGTLGDCKLFQLGGGGGEAGSEAERIGKGRSGDLVNHGRDSKHHLKVTQSHQKDFRKR